MTEAAIYALVTPRTGAIRYVGYSIDPARRYARHLWAARRGSRLQIVSVWIARLLHNGSQPTLVVIERVPRGDPNDREAHWIAHHRSAGARLLNVSPGKTPTPAAEARRRAGDKLKGRTLSAETRARISASKLAAKTKRPDAADTARRMAAANRGRKMILSDAERQRRAESLAAVTHLSRLAQAADPQYATRQSEKMKAVWAARSDAERSAIGKKRSAHGR